MTELAELAGKEAREGSSPGAASGSPNPQIAQRARGSLALPSVPTSAAVTQRVRRAGAAASRAADALTRPGTLVHAQPPTFRQAHDRHKECAGWFRTPAVAFLRRMWGWFHLLAVLPPLYLAAWVTESPLRLLVAAALIAAIWLWS